MNLNENEDALCAQALSFKATLKSVVEECLNSVPDEDFVYIYKSFFKDFVKKDDVKVPSLSGSSKEAKKYRQQFNDAVLKDAMTDIDDMMGEYEMNKKLEVLQNLVLECGDKDKTCKAWRPPGNARKHIEAFDYQVKLNQKKEIEKLLEEDHREIKQLESEVAEKRQIIVALHKNVVKTNEKLKNICSVSPENKS